jgi:alpha-1,2-mannosyltransferase
MYPPADIGDKSKKITNIRDNPAREEAIVSLAQFRPEKNHALQLHVFSKILRNRPNTVFYVMGGVRNSQDERLVDELKSLAFDILKLPKENIHFVINASREDVNERLKKAKCAIHTMIDEHFGISLLEYLEAKLPVVCHRSGGPEMDILLPDEKFGYLAADEDEFTGKVLHVLSHFDSNEIKQKRIAGYNSLSRFLSDDAFGKLFAKTFL